MDPAFRTFLSKSGVLLVSQPLAHKGFPFLPLCKIFFENAKMQKKNIYVTAVFEHCFSIKWDQKSSSNACGVLKFRVW